MPQARTQDRPSFFSEPSADQVTKPWSGRVSVDDVARPGGLLFAALWQCAQERGLSLSDLATAMGVSYWSLSQLRIGFRPIEALDEDLAVACAAFLDLPRLTVDMLAGLLGPAQALAEEDLGGEDIQHARQLLANAPEDLVLLPPANRARPLQGLAVDELAALHRDHGSNPAVVAVLRAELNCRPMSKTELLRAALGPVAAAEPAPAAVETPLPHGILRCSCCQKRLRVPHLAEPSEIRCPGCQTEYAVHWQDSVCLVERIAAPEAADAPDEEADEEADDEAVVPDPASPWRVLGLADNSPWDAVERARRSLLQQYHPDRLGHVSPLVRQLAEEAFKRVSEAYDTLKSRQQ
ncbi:DnaJ domain-containing protein [Methyloversatilis sp.]|uniref:DnaJ domain-containing protein n=1 Tax=Methyloversatilis sp. TaxID=2569862 RepID=UPI0027343AD5|nr:DnaJ domain-containing protein [Methyloversatilis sp.]MDP3578916.1 DnaJ domain-containing protein [Methyloversatilis sp.]